MKPLYTIFLYAFMAFITLNLNAEDFKKSYHEQYSVNTGALLLIENKFGDVKCINWDENAVSIDVVITVEASSKSKADDLLSKISINLAGSPDKVSGITTIGSLRGNNQFSINYTVKMPRHMKVDISNKYGGLIMEELEGSSRISVKYGSLHIGSLLNADNKLNIEYTDNAIIDYVENAFLTLSYSELEIKDSEFLDVKSRYNEVELGNIAELQINSGYDEYGIDKTRKMNAYSDFSEIDIVELTHSLVLEMKYGGLEIDRIAAGFEQIKVNAAYAELDLTFDQEAVFQLLVNESYSEIDISPKNAVRRTELSYTSSRYEGKIGAGKSTAGVVTVDLKHGELDLQ